MPATVWKGHLTFGLISIPVKLHRAARAERVSFRQIHEATASRVKQVYVREEATYDQSEAQSSQQYEPRQQVAFTAPTVPESAARPQPIPIRGKPAIAPLSPGPAPVPVIDRSELVKGYEYEKGRYVTISKEDLEKITPPTAREMQILEFVELADIDPVYFETSYYVTPERAGERAYALLFEALRRSSHVALAQFAMHNREHIVVVRPGRTGIIVHTMFYETEIRHEDEYQANTAAIDEKELALALRLIENLGASFKPSKYRDTYKEKLDAIIAAKIGGEERVEAIQSKPKRSNDILAALEQSLALMKKPAASQGPAAAKKRKTK